MRRSARHLAWLAFAATLTACYVAPPPPPAPARPALPVRASFDVTWNSAIDHFAQNNIPIATIEKASGIIVADRLTVPPGSGFEYANCGGNPGFPLAATSVVYNILVRGDAAASTVHVTAAWSSERAAYECTTKGVWEAEAEGSIKTRAESTS